MLRRLLWLLLALVLAVPLLLAGAAYGLLGTEPGSRWLLGQARKLANEQVADLRLDWQGLEGKLLGELRLHGLEVEQPSLLVGAETLVLRWRPRSLLERHLHIETLSATGLRYRGRSREDEAPEPPTALELPDIALPLRITLDRLAVERARIEHDEFVYEVRALTLAAAYDGELLEIRDLVLDSEQAELAGRFEIETQRPHALGVQLRGSGQVPQLGRIRARLGGGGPALQPRLELELSAPRPLSVHAELDLRQAEPRFDLDASWPELAWPLQGDPDYRSLDGRLTVAGTPTDYRLTLGSGVRGRGLPELALDLKGRGDTTGLELQPLAVQLLEGRVDVRGRVDWSPEPAWELAVEAQELDPGTYPFPDPAAAPDLSGRLSARLTSRGRLVDGQPRLELEIAELDGRLRDQPLRGEGRLEIDQGPAGLRLIAQGLDLATGPNRVRVDGRLDQTIDLGFEIRAPDLSQLRLLPDAELAGAIEGRGRLGGTRQQPTLEARLSGAGLVFQANRIDQLALDADWTEQGGQILFNAVDAELGGTAVEQASLGLSGRPEAHRLDLEATAGARTLALGAEGAWLAPAWQGQLQQLTLTDPQLGGWALGAPAALSLASERAKLDRLCLQSTRTSTAPSGNGQVCVRGRWQAEGTIELEGRIEQLALGLFGPLLPDALAIDGSLEGQLQVTGRVDAPQARLDLTPSDGRLRLAATDEPLEVPYRNARITARYGEDGGEARLNLELGENGRAEGRVKLGPAPQQSLAGSVSASFPDLSLVAGLVPALESTAGRMELSAGFAGTLAEPRITGEFEVAGARARIPEVGIEIEEIELRARGDGRGPLRIDGGARSGDGRVSLAGTIDLDSRGLPLDLAVNGEDFRVAMLPEALVEISPELRVSGADPYRVTGRLVIPRAEIEIKEIPASAVSVSRDEVVVGREEEGVETGTPGVEADVQVELGDRVSFKGFGLQTRLTGAVRANSNPRGTSLNGKIELVDARYKAYGQDLTVEQGRLLFAGPPDNPALDLRAVRNSRDGKVRAYLAMSGPLSRPRPRIYSEPALPDVEALAYLVTGRGLDQAGKGDGLDIANAAISLGIAQGEPLLQGMADRLGLDELQVQTGEGGLEQSSLMLGKYLSPDLYVGYTHGLFDAAAQVLVRLQLTERVEVESRAGTSQSVDVFYKLEHD